MVLINGNECVVDAGDSAAAATIRAGLGWTRTSPVTGDTRAPYCLMGVCFECLMTIDGETSVQACLVKVRPGMRIDMQSGAPSLVE
ncbi:(2Fe-2S)-binding protein [Ensifer sp. YR511]|uniref:(2Fe-2S)-binding protein n=1 Tax=Ensifer sp. YR511 TaxID=1855294 RepID=UPI001AEC8896|nr:(2Fe-2S)-binding protein [Ensifer sp. YR511]